MHGASEPPQTPVHCACVLKDRKPCKFPPVRDSAFCAHHRLRDPSGAVTRVDCPVDPTHTVPLAGLRKHLKRCPRAVQLRHQAEQPYYRPGCNDGSGDEVDLGSSIRRHPSERAAGSNGIALNGSDQHAPAAGLPVLRRPPPSSAERAAYAAQLGEAKLRELIARVRRAHAEVRSLLPDSVEELRPEEWDEQLRSANPLRPFSLKHARQQASIVGHMQCWGLAPCAARLQAQEHSIEQPPCSQQQPYGSAAVTVDCGRGRLPAPDALQSGPSAGSAAERTNAEATFVEFGAGKGYLTALLAECTGARRLVMMDLGAFGLKADRYLRDCDMIRARCDISDFDPQGVPAITESAAGWVAMGKHLCGGATDLMLRCCVRNPKASTQGDSTHDTGRLRGLAVATCCHHRCSWRQYVCKAFFRERGFSSEEFELICWMTGWALCGHNAAPIADAAEPAVDSIEQPVAAERVPVSKSPENCASPAHTALKLSQHVTSPASDQLAADDSGAEPPHRAGSSIPRAEKQAVGMLCKQLLDCGRLLWLRLQGFEAEMRRYVPASVSGENMLLVAKVT